MLIGSHLSPGTTTGFEAKDLLYVQNPRKGIYQPFGVYYLISNINGKYLFPNFKVANWLPGILNPPIARREG
jgi:hypothetical protein